MLRSVILAAFFLAFCLPVLAAPAIEGEWAWGAGAGSVVIRADGTGLDSRGNSMNWRLADPATRTYSFVWSHGFTDTAVLSEDGNTLEVVNNVGTRFTCTRRTPAPAADSAEPAAPPVADDAAGPGPDLARSVDAVTPAGRWKWGTGADLVEIARDGTGSDDRDHTMTWVVIDAAQRIYEFRWSHGYTDRATLSADGERLDIVNSVGSKFTAVRLGAAPAPTTPAAPGGVDLTGSWSGGLVHIWQDGTVVFLTAAWTRPDGKAVCVKGEGTLDGRTVTLRVVYAPMTYGPVPEWTGKLVVSDDGDTLDATYTLPGAEPDRRTYRRDR